jgi:predicted NUDIX family NTP pyrophosphohydrolase
VPQPRSAGILLYRFREEVEVLLAHPGGPFWQSRDLGAWMIPKGAIEAGETPAEAAVREYCEEVGGPPPAAPWALCSIRQKAGKLVDVFAAEGDFDPAFLKSSTFEMEWPPRSGIAAAFPEIDKARWMTLGEARAAILPSQSSILDALEERIRAGSIPRLR